MKKFIIIDIWNGEGYSESKAFIKEFESRVEAEKYCEDEAQHQAEAIEGETYALKYKSVGDGWGYSDDEDAGSYYAVELKEDMIAVLINPNVNNFRILTSQQELDEAVENAVRHGDNDEDVNDALLSGGHHIHGVLSHSGDLIEGYDVIFQLISELEDDGIKGKIRKEKEKVSDDLNEVMQIHIDDKETLTHDMITDVLRKCAELLRSDF